MKNKIIILLLSISIVAAAIFSAHIPPYWNCFSISAIVIIVLLFTLNSKPAESKKSIQSKTNELTFENLIEGLEADVMLGIQKESLENEDELINRINHQLFLLNKNIDLIKQKYGIKKFADIIIPFSRAERLLNRAISAFTDAYFLESKNNLIKSHAFINLTSQKLNSD